RDGPHWDLMLERPGVEREHRLATWSLLKLPRAWATAIGAEPAAANEEVAATELADHRAWYLDHDGPLRSAPGSVARLAGGECVWGQASRDECRVTLLGGAGFAGQVSLSRRHGAAWSVRWEASETD
ncbi:MAG: hypothetical protein AAF805_08800, partial [Planctomycetota bacterium]